MVRFVLAAKLRSVHKAAVSLRSKFYEMVVAQPPMWGVGDAAQQQVELGNKIDEFVGEQQVCDVTLHDLVAVRFLHCNHYHSPTSLSLWLLLLLLIGYFGYDLKRVRCDQAK